MSRPALNAQVSSRNPKIVLIFLHLSPASTEHGPTQDVGSNVEKHNDIGNDHRHVLNVRDLDKHVGLGRQVADKWFIEPIGLAIRLITLIGVLWLLGRLGVIPQTQFLFEFAKELFPSLL